MKTAVVVDWLTVYSGAERVVEQILEIYPECELFSLIDFLGDDQRGFIKGKKVNTSFIQRLPFARTKYRSYLALMPLAVEQFDLSQYDLVISSSHAVAKGVLTGPDQVHVSYVHSPIRYAWDLQHQYLQESGLTAGLKSWLARWVLHYIRNFDARSSLGVDVFLTNSKFVARRVNKFYRREAQVVYPPVNLDDFSVEPVKQNYYVCASRLVPYKKMGLIAEAFARMPDRQLVIIGDGPEIHKVRAAAKCAPNIKVAGYLPFADMKTHMQNARAFVFAAEEDFGITPLEAMACGTPVIAFGKGGALETVVEGETGVFFYEQSAAAIMEAVDRFEGVRFTLTAEKCRGQAERFSVGVFKQRFSSAISSAMQAAKTQEH